MLNKTFLMGRLTHDPELKHTTSGTTYVQFSLAVERDFKDKQSGEKITDFIDCVAWTNTAEFICKYFAKGRMMVATGRIQVESYNDKDGNKRRSVKVVVDNAYFGDSKRDQQNDQQNGQSSGDSASSATKIDNFVQIQDTVGDDELPFI